MNDIVAIATIVFAIGISIFAASMVPIMICRGLGRPGTGIGLIAIVIILTGIDYHWNWSSIKYPHWTFALLTETAPLSIVAMFLAILCGFWLADR